MLLPKANSQIKPSFVKRANVSIPFLSFMPLKLLQLFTGLGLYQVPEVQANLRRIKFPASSSRLAGLCPAKSEEEGGRRGEKEIPYEKYLKILLTYLGLI
jgi:hypothetical protein